MSVPPQLPERLRNAIAADLEPVRPLPRPWLRALDVAAWGVIALLAVVGVLGLRSDLARLGWMLSWGAALLESAAGLYLVVLALREAIPGSGPSALQRAVSLAVALLAPLAVALLTWARGTGVRVANPLLDHGPACFSAESALGLPALLLTGWLVVRAFPVRPAWAGALGGGGAGMLADGIYHLHCPISDLRHVLVWHLGAVVVLGLVGWWSGRVIERHRASRLTRRA